MAEVKSLDHTRFVVVAICKPVDKESPSYKKYYRGAAEHRGSKRNVWSETLAEAKAFTDLNSVTKLIEVLHGRVKVDAEYVSVTIKYELMDKKELMIARIKG